MDYTEKKGLKEMRRSYGLTQGELGKMFGMTQMHISLFELGQWSGFQPVSRLAASKR